MKRAKKDFNRDFSGTSYQTPFVISEVSEENIVPLPSNDGELTDYLAAIYEYLDKEVVARQSCIAPTAANDNTPENPQALLMNTGAEGAMAEKLRNEITTLKRVQDAIEAGNKEDPSYPTCLVKTENGTDFICRGDKLLNRQGLTISQEVLNGWIAAKSQDLSATTNTHPQADVDDLDMAG